MIFSNFSKENNRVCIQYKSILPPHWGMIIDIMQAFFDDIKENLIEASSFVIAGGENINILPIPEGLLYKAEYLQEERGGISLRGVSQVFNAEMKMTAYNQLKNIIVEVPEGSELFEKLLENNHVLDVYMASVGHNAIYTDVSRAIMRTYNKALKDKDLSSLMTIKRCANNYGVPYIFEDLEKELVNVGAQEEPKYIINTCPMCNTKAKINESKIPPEGTYNYLCPKCGAKIGIKKA